MLMAKLIKKNRTRTQQLNALSLCLHAGENYSTMDGTLKGKINSKFWLCCKASRQLLTKDINKKKYRRKFKEML